eukprot:gnl/TRDRNA2_/TRDRNA2_194901_c0_seq1.p1 gnl/TRDRNA2_/TRDRNA2_194901_c0~~gnl/TRDRNA2_/TRDRNA2_194901_c0_seq1.p1  ORF type:complete len:407 (-),score=82.02 gnl/TRDRNA2_/TRDRNA2_194901_c0_seq1:49-1269(-)
MGILTPLEDRAAFDRSLAKEVLIYLESHGVSQGLLDQLRSELAGSEPPLPSSTLGPEPQSCRLVRAWRYAEDGLFEVSVSRLSGAIDTFEVHQWTSVQDLKDQIEARMRIPVCEQVLLKSGLELKGGKDCLAAYRLTFCKNSLEVLQVETRADTETPGSLQIQLTCADGIPPGSIVSIRAGETRRQAALCLDKPFVFATRKDEANPFKINIFSELGHARLTLRPGEMCYVAHIEDDSGARVARLEFEARDNSEGEKKYKLGVDAKTSGGGPGAGGDASGTGVGPSSGAVERVQKSVIASRYLDEHGLYQYMQGLIQSLLTERPVNPYQYMIQQLQAADLAWRGKQSADDTQAQAQALPSPEPETAEAPMPVAEAATSTGNPSWSHLPSTGTWFQSLATRHVTGSTD